MKKLVFITSVVTLLCFAFAACKKKDIVLYPSSTGTNGTLSSLPVSFNRGIMGINPFEDCISGPGVCKMNVRSKALSIQADLVSDNDSAVIRIPITYYNAYVKDFAGDSIKISSEVLLDSATAKELIAGNNPQWKCRPLPVPKFNPALGGGFNIIFPAGYYRITFKKDGNSEPTHVDIRL